MLQGRLTRLPTAAAAVLLLGACASVDGTDDGAIRDAVVEPGVTAIGESEALACGSDASTLRTALEAYELLEGEQAPDEAALVAEQYIRAESELWDIRMGRLVPQDPACGEAPAEVPGENVTEIVTDDRPPTSDELGEFADRLAAMTPDDIVADASEQEIADVGGPTCAREIAEVSLGLARWTVDRGGDPGHLASVVEDGYAAPPMLWVVTDATLEAAAGSGCTGTVPLLDDTDCAGAYRTLAAALEAYTIEVPDAAAPPSEADLVDAGLMRSELSLYDVVDGDIAPDDSGTCPADPLAGTPPTTGG